MRRSVAAALLALIPAAAACGSPGSPATTLPSLTTGPTAPEAAATTTTPVPTSSSPASTTAAATTTTAPPATTGPSLPVEDLDLALVEVAAGFAAPLFVAAPPGDDRLFVVEQGGRIQLLQSGGGVSTFLDLSAQVSSSGEQGLLGLAFHPAYPDDGRLYVNYTDRQGDTVVVEYRVSPDPAVADPASGRVLLAVDQPAPNHNGGMIAFGPDGYLYVGLGDGGGAGDPYATGQDPSALLGSILRIDVDGDPYAIPPDNPYADGGGAPEVWAKGLRNPWRFSFDAGSIYIGDVGQASWEEVNIAPIATPGLNFGWSVVEGRDCFGAEDCDPDAYLPPAFAYGHTDGNCSVTGGYVYRGGALPELAGAYFFGDYCSGMIASLRHGPEGIYELHDWGDALGRVPGLTSFGLDGRGELYVTSADGSVYRLEGR